MNIFHSIRVLIIGICSLVAMPVHSAPVLTQRQVEIMQQIMAIDGSLDKQTHDEFWALLPPFVRDDPQQIKEMQEGFYDTSKDGFIVMKEFWVSAKLSAQEKRAVKTAEFKSALEKLASLGGPSAKVAEVYNILIEKILDAAVVEGSFDFPFGRKNITPEFCDWMIERVGEAEERARLLMEPTWVDGSP